MLTKLTIKNFKRFESAEIELGNPIVFIGPNNSGKTTALQALALWGVGATKWLDRYGNRIEAGRERTGVPISRGDLFATPVSTTDLLWNDRHVRRGKRANGKTTTENIRITIEVEGISGDRAWSFPVEFDYSNAETLYARAAARAVLDAALVTAVRAIRVAYLPPMSGLVAVEDRLVPGSINVRIGEGRTADVLRNLCYRVYAESGDEALWAGLVAALEGLFGLRLLEPQFNTTRGTIELTYRTQKGVELDLASAGRGFQQVLLILAYLAVSSDTVLLLDEPDAHLEILRQRKIYDLLRSSAESNGNQVIIVSHSEAVLEEARDDVVVAFVGAPHRMESGFSQIRKALNRYAFDQYYQSELRRRVLYVEGTTDRAILAAFAQRLGHPAASILDYAFVVPVGNKISDAEEHFFAMRTAVPDLRGLAILDGDREPSEKRGRLVDEPLPRWRWARREIENYLCGLATVEAFVRDDAATRVPGPLFVDAEAARRAEIVAEEYRRLVPPAALDDPHDAFWWTVKASDDLLDRVFAAFFERLGLPNLMRKSGYHRLAAFVAPADIDPEIIGALDAIAVAWQGAPEDDYAGG